MLPGAVKDKRSSSPDWELSAPKISGVQVKEIRNIPTGNGTTVELYRQDWGLHDRPITQIISVSLHPGAISAWHCHEIQTDHVMVVSGAMRGVLYDAREDSPTKGALDILNLSEKRPRLLVIPPLVFHGFKNVSGEKVIFNNFFDRQYNYEEPDEWRLPWNSDSIPYKFER
jgi:dTDP-4-dehydrorhamnose 3,5-epimerase